MTPEQLDRMEMFAAAALPAMLANYLANGNGLNFGSMNALATRAFEMARSMLDLSNEIRKNNAA